MKKLASTAATGLLLASMAMSASAVTITDSVHFGGHPDYSGQDLSFSSSNGTTVNVQGYTGGSDYTLDQDIFRDHVYSWQGGLGVWNGHKKWDHGISNQAGYYQMALLDFGEEVRLDSFVTSWNKDPRNSFASVLAYTDNSAFTGLNNLSWRDLQSSGWEHAGSPDAYNHFRQGEKVSVQGGLLSQYWLVGVYNPAFGGQYNYLFHESFKLKGVHFSTFEDVSEIPLPAAAWLFLTGLAGMGWMKKRKAKREQAEVSVA